MKQFEAKTNEEIKVELENLMQTWLEKVRYYAWMREFLRDEIHEDKEGEDEYETRIYTCSKFTRQLGSVLGKDIGDDIDIAIQKGIDSYKKFKGRGL